MSPRPRGSVSVMVSTPQFRGPIPFASWRAGIFVVLTLIETVLGSSLYGVPLGQERWTNPVCYTNLISFILLLAGIAFPLIAWTRRRELAQSWAEAVRSDDWGVVSILLNLSLFALLLTARASLSQLEAASIPWGWYWAYSLLLLGTGASLALVAAPVQFLSGLVRSTRLELVLAIGAACFIVASSLISQESWSALSYATLVVSHWMLGLYEGNLFVDFDARMLGAEGFRVEILPACSGYEGIGLIIAFLAIYLWVFRAQLRFPHAFFLVPIGVGAIWLLNSVRIAALISIGAHLSPTVALGGFHSWSGWIAFLIVTVSIMAASRRSAFLWAAPSAAAAAVRQAHDDPVVAQLAPFAAFMAASIVASAFVPADHWLYGLKVLAIGGALYAVRSAYSGWVARVSPIAILAGAGVGVAWILTDPERGLASPLGDWLTALPVWLAVLWLALRTLGSVVLVPVAEELAFRGYLYRGVAAWRRLGLGQTQMRWIALIVSSLAFGLLHDRWLAAMLSGVVYAGLMHRSDRLADPIAAHMSSNALIMAWSIAAQQWSLL